MNFISDSIHSDKNYTMDIFMLVPKVFEPTVSLEDREDHFIQMNIIA